MAKPKSKQELTEISHDEKSVQDLDPAFVEEMMKDAGLGVSTRPSDNITPAIKVLQSLSPQITGAQGASKIPGAEAGDFLLADTLDVISGEEGIWFQPVTMTEWWFEFIPRERGGGFVARYPVKRNDNDEIIPPEGAEQDEDNPNRYFFSETENNCTYYRFIPGIMWREGEGLEYVIPFFSTGHTVARGWNTKWTRLRFPNGQMMPACSHVYHLNTKLKTNKLGSWHIIEVGKPMLLDNMKEVVGNPVAAYRMGKALAQAFTSGARIETTDVQDDVHHEERTKDEEIPY